MLFRTEHYPSPNAMSCTPFVLSLGLRPTPCAKPIPSFETLLSIVSEDAAYLLVPMDVTFAAATVPGVCFASRSRACCLQPAMPAHACCSGRRCAVQKATPQNLQGPNASDSRPLHTSAPRPHRGTLAFLPRFLASVVVVVIF